MCVKETTVSIFVISLFCAFMLHAQESITTDSSSIVSAESDVAFFSDTNFGITLNPGLGFSMDVLKLPTLRFDPGLMFYGNFLGDTLSIFLIQADVQYAQGSWFYNNEGERIDPYSAEAHKATWRQWNLFGNLMFRQGLVAGTDLQTGDLITFVAMYSARFYPKLKSQSPDAYIFESDRPDAVNNIFQNRVSAGLEYKKYASNKLYNTRKGSVGGIIFQAVPKCFGNDVMGLSDFYQVSADMRNYIPITQSRTFSMYVYEALSYDFGWGDFIPITDAYGSPSACPVRGSFLYDATMHMSHNLELRMSFPNAIDFGVMPGFNMFYDCGIYDNYDYAFSKSNFMQSAGMSFVMHMDSLAITPFSYQLDLQFGVAYDITQSIPTFWFSIFFPGSESQM